MRGVPAPGEVGRVPAVKGPLPMGEQLGIVQRAPAACDRIAFEVDGYPALPCFDKQLFMGRD